MKKKTITFSVIVLLLFISIVVVYASINATPNGNDTQSANEQIRQFADVNEADWFYEDVKYVNENNLMKGTGNDCFSPNGSTTRGMIVTILWRLEGEPVVDSKVFSDVKKDAYYFNAVAWASNNQVVSGYDEKLFGPEDFATREQLATIMYRYAAYKKFDLSKTSTLAEYTDKNQISAYAVTAIGWAHANGIITGTSANTLTPGDNVQRCQVAAILKRFCTQFTTMKENTASEENKNTNESANEGADESKDLTVGTNHQTGNEPPEEEPNDNSAHFPLITIASVSAKPGDNVQMFVDIKNNPGILGMTLSAYYDENNCTLQSVENGTAFRDILDLTTSKTLGSGARFIWDGVEISKENIKDGSIITLNFSVSQNAKKGKYPVVVQYSAGDIVDNNLEDVAPVIENGYITVVSE